MHYSIFRVPMYVFRGGSVIFGFYLKDIFTNTLCGISLWIFIPNPTRHLLANFVPAFKNRISKMNRCIELGLLFSKFKQNVFATTVLLGILLRPTY